MFCASDLESDYLPPRNQDYEVVIETNTKLIQRAVNKLLSQYKDEKRGPTLLVVQSSSLGIFPILPQFVSVTTYT